MLPTRLDRCLKTKNIFRAHVTNYVRVYWTSRLILLWFTYDIICVGLIRFNTFCQWCFLRTSFRYPSVSVSQSKCLSIKKMSKYQYFTKYINFSSINNNLTLTLTLNMSLHTYIQNSIKFFSVCLFFPSNPRKGWTDFNGTFIRGWKRERSSGQQLQ